MSRRDTIILAVLINAALLSILFFTATRPDMSELAQAKPTLQHPTPIGGLAASRSEADQRTEPLVRGFVPLQQEPVRPATPQRIFEDHFSPTMVAVADEEAEDEDAEPEQAYDSEYVEVVVKRGDFLEKIARANGTTVGEVKRINHLANDRIDIGQVLLVPASRKPTAVKLPVALAQSNDANAEYYIMKPGDNPWNIARQHHVNFEEFLRLNHLDEAKARNLKPGDKLRVR